MSKVINSLYGGSTPSLFSAPNRILSSTYVSLLRDQTHLYTRDGARVCGWGPVAQIGGWDPAYYITSSTFSPLGESEDRECGACLTLDRDLGDDTLRLKIRLYGQNFDLKAHLIEMESKSELANVTITGTSLGWYDGELEITSGEGDYGGQNMPLYLYFEAKSEISAGYIYQLEVFERLLVAGDESLLPNAVSDAYVPVGAVPVVITPPVISGAYVLGGALTSTTGSWSNSPTSYAYQWQRDGVDIIGATTSTYVLTGLDIKGVMTCSVIATNGTGSSSPSTSNALHHALKGIYDIASGALIWVYDEGISASLGSPISSWATIDGAQTWVQATGTRQPTLTATGVSFDGTSDWLSCDGAASAFDGGYTVYHGISDVSTANNVRTLWMAADNGVSTLVRDNQSVNYAHGSAALLSRMRLLSSDSSLAVQVSLMGLWDASGVGPYHYIARSYGPGVGNAETYDMTDPPTSLDSGSRPSGTTAHDLLTLGAYRLTAASTGTGFWLGKVQFFVLIPSRLSDFDMDAVRDILASAGYL